MNNLLIFAEKTAPRLEYTCRLIFTQHLGVAYAITTDQQAFDRYTGPKIWYGSAVSDYPVQITSTGLLFETGISEQDIKTTDFNGLTVPFSAEGGSFPFDLFTAVFYMLSRYEEYLPFEPNQYGQFKATDSLAFKLGFLDKPVVDIWIEELKAALQKNYPALQFKTKQFSAVFTYDIDVAYAYKGRPLYITLGNLLNDLVRLRTGEIAKRLKTLLGLAIDPFDTYPFISEQQKKYGFGVIFFHLLGKKNKYNRNIDAGKKVLQQLIKSLGGRFTTGIHPSYYTDGDFNLLQKEKGLLQEMLGRNITISRQHYLRLLFPATFQNLLKAGITDDYTIGYGEMPGFRAGTCTSYPFYNLVTETETTLILHPAACMDVTFTDDLKLEPAASLQLIKKLIDAIKAVNGNFIFIWHNNTLSNLNGWKEMTMIHNETGAYVTERLKN